MKHCKTTQLHQLGYNTKVPRMTLYHVHRSCYDVRVKMIKQYLLILKLFLKKNIKRLQCLHETLIPWDDQIMRKLLMSQSFMKTSQRQHRSISQQRKSRQLFSSVWNKQETMSLIKGRRTILSKNRILIQDTVEQVLTDSLTPYQRCRILRRDQLIKHFTHQKVHGR